MSNQKLNLDAEMEGEQGKVRKRGLSSSSSTSAQNYRLKRTFLMGKRRGSTTPVPTWKMIASQSQSLQNHRCSLFGGNAKDLSVSARALAAFLWEIDGAPILEDKRIAKHTILDPSLNNVSEMILDPDKLCSGRRRQSAGCRKPLRPSSNLRSSTSIAQVDGMQNHVHGLRDNLKDVYNGLIASKQLLEVLSRVGGLEQPECISSTLVSALGVELERSCNRVSKLIQGQKKTEKSEMDDVMMKQTKHGIHRAVPSTVVELEMEKKLRRRIEKLNRKTEAELAETRAALARAVKELESEKKARRKVEQVCEELARGVWELKRQFAKVREEVEKEREMFHLADLLREERLQMKLSDAKCLYEEKNALVDKLRNEVEAYLEGTKCGRKGDDSPRHNRRNELERILKETFQGLQRNQGKENEEGAAVNQDEEESDDSDLHSIELSIEEISKSFMWRDAVDNGSKRNCVDTSKGRIPKKQPFIQSQKLQMPLLS
ncbi:uncharacterized protein LOC131000223 isoform X2 [Salvia miltiorrhiza]|uniref:uncharacterized protein LOC131000223 isoform X2 n=1 Tax=Salvia miltiorrhiza TaxID=226208 RepID=UPI0025ACF294|nr:uncharacterized protein LOC131000223 isoform X2 [Salvia miltiorrhiza]